jgi:outer membrane lipoprotein-sorting protein
MPVKIETLDPNETTIRTTELKDIKVNSNLKDSDFKLDEIDEKTWRLTDEPFEQ